MTDAVEPELHLVDKPYKIGSKIKLVLRNIPAEGGDVPVLQTSPADGLETIRSERDGGTTVEYTLLSRKYGVFKVTVAGYGNCRVFVNVTPLGELILPRGRVSGNPPIQKPWDLLVTRDGGFVVADGFRKKVIRMDERGANQTEFELPRDVKQEDFVPISLAMKEDKESEENEEIYVTDIISARVHVYHGTKYLESFGKNVLKKPTGIAIDEDGFIFVADHHEKQILQFDRNHQLVEDRGDAHELCGPQLMRIHKPDSPESPSTLFVADRNGSSVTVFVLLRGTTSDDDDSEEESTRDDPRPKSLSFVTKIIVDLPGVPEGPILPFCLVCDPDGHMFISGQVKIAERNLKGYIWFKDANSSNFGERYKVPDWAFGDGLRNPGGMRIVDRPGDGRYLYVTDMRGKNANNCINKYTLKKYGHAR